MQENIGLFHPILVHFPIALFTVALLCDLLNGIGKSAALPVAHWMIIGGALMCLPTIATGWEAAAAYPPEHPFLHQHRFFALTTSAVGLTYALFRFLVLRKGWQFHPILYVTCSVVLLSLVALTADYGGLVAHGVSPFDQIFR